jgi:phosphohistidine swiveling domain-containing protein
MASLVLNGNTSGSVTISSPAVSGTTTLTLPTTSGTVITTGSTFGGTGPAFSAYSNATQSISQATFTKVAINTEIFDTNSNFDSTTNYRFTPTVAGYYQVNGTVRLTGTTGAEFISALYKNGSVYSRGSNITSTANTLGVSQLTFNEIVYLNGSTDYIELYGYVNAASGQQLVYNAADVTSRFSASMIRGA